MKKIFLFFLVIFSFTKVVYSLDLTAQSAILIDATSGEILYEKDCHQRMFPASTTKIMTAILILERGNLDDVVTVSKKASTRFFGESSIWVKEGEKIRLRDLLYAILIKSANDAAVASAEYIAGTVSEFVKLMNEKAGEIGCINTNFENPHGFCGKNHYTSAYDLSLMARYALENKDFAKIVKIKKKIIPWPGKPWNRVLINRNKLLWKYKYCNGIKTGYTKSAGHCLVASATKNGFTLISVVLKSGEVWKDSIKLLEYGFNNFKPVVLSGKGKCVKEISLIFGTPRKIKLITQKKCQIVQIKNEKRIKVKTHLVLDKIKIPLKKNEVVGRMLFLDENKNIISLVNLVSSEDVKRNWFITFFFYSIIIIIISRIYFYIVKRNKKLRIIKRRRNLKEIKLRNLSLGGK